MKWIVFFYLKYLFIILFLGMSHVRADESEAHAFEPVFRILSSNAISTLDPQKSSVKADHTLSAYFFDPLFTLKQGEPVPVLVENYDWQSPTRWVFSLKKGVLFHDGSELTSRDVVATFKRAFRLKNKVYTHIEGKVKAIKALSDYRFQIDTEEPHSELLWSLDGISIINHTAEQASSDAFDQGDKLIGTGPYQLVERQGYKQFTLKAFLGYHRGGAYIRNVSLHSEVSADEKVQAFLRGEADLIGALTDDQLMQLRGKANITSLPSSMLYFLVPDVYRDSSPDIRDNTGNIMKTNPLKDLRVRRAISKALDREALIKGFFGKSSLSQAAGQLVNDDNKSFSPAMKPDNQNLTVARKLLEEAGYPDGFQITLRDRDSRRRLIELIADMLSQVNIKVQVESLPPSEFFPRALAGEFSLISIGYSTHGNLGEMLKVLLYTGVKGNIGRYSNSALDQQIDKAMSQTSTIRKRRKLRKAHEMAIGDLAIIPVLFPQNSWAIRPDMVFKPTGQMYTEAYYVSPLLK